MAAGGKNASAEMALLMSIFSMKVHCSSPNNWRSFSRRGSVWQPNNLTRKYLSPREQCPPAGRRTFAGPHQLEGGTPRNRGGKCDHWPLSCEMRGPWVRAQSREL